jgi:hypothetical protein
MISISIYTMLQSLRDYFPKWLIAFLFGVLALLMVGGSVYSPSSSASKAANAVLVRVNKAKIRKLHLEMAYETVKQQVAGSGFKITPEMERGVRMGTLKQLVMMEVLKQRAYANNYRVHPEDVLNLIKQIPELQVDNQFSPQSFKQLLAATGYTKAAFLKELTESRMMSQLSETIMGSAFVLPNEIHQVVRLTNQQRDFSYLELKTQHFMPSATQLTVEEARAYYDQHLTEFRVPEQVSIDYILLSRAEMLEALKSTHPRTPTLEEQAAKQFQEAVDRLAQLSDKHSYSLIEVARSSNAAIQSTPLFDRMGGSSEITQHPEVIMAAFSPEVRQGYNSRMIRLDSERVVILRLKKHQPLRLPSFEEVQKVVYEQLSLQKARQNAQHYGEQLIEKIKQDSTALLDLPAYSQWSKVEKVTRNNEKIPAPILNAAFAMPSQGKISTVQGVALPNGDYAVIRLFKVRYGKLSQLEDKEYDLYRDALTAERGQLDYLHYGRANERRAKITYSLNS